ncbi:hypothetical protein PHISP_07268 [Aspergillus sp. HF37]|nr:hypothetical protein PHISP_07268 [Aspergillus sp. HF37]
MPPVNSPSETRPLSPENSTTSGPVPLSADGPVVERHSSAAGVAPNPSTEADDANDDNVSFLRQHRISPLSYAGISSAARRERRRQQYAADSTDSMDVDNTENPIDANRRMRIVRHRQEEMANVPNYESGSNNSQSLYGWAPSSDNDEAERSVLRRSSEALNAWFRSLEPRHPAMFRNPAHRETSDRDPPQVSDETADHDDDGDALTAAETVLHHYLLDRDPSNRPSHARDRDYSPHRPYRLLPNRGPPSDRPAVRASDRHSGPHICLNGYRRPQMVGRDNPRMKDAIRYLHRLQYADSHEDGLECATSFGFIPRDDPQSSHPDLALDTESITLPTECSWLRPGMVFLGSQKAAHSTIPVYSRRMPGNLSPLFHYAGDPSGRSRTDRDENWPVKVTIHDIDYEEMTLSGTMEAYNIPDKTCPNHDAHIVTFLEGEIIDLKKHTLETMNFKANVDVDSTYWRQLYPFKGVEDDEELVSNLVSRRWMKEQLGEDWVLMRWKERCFITPTDSRQGLTISGFYYIVLRRDTGKIEGLYYDPGSSPYQQLTLKPERYRMVRPSYEFR